MEKIPVVFILGCGHSGSTILDLLLNAHSEMVGTGEIEKVGVKTIVGYERCSCTRAFPECDFWQEYITTRGNNSFFTKHMWQLGQSKSNFLTNSPQFTPLARVGSGSSFRMPSFEIEPYLRDTVDLYQYIRAKSGKKIVIDSSKNTVRANALERLLLQIEPYYIHIVRDGRGVTWSYAKKYNRYWKYMTRWFLENAKAEVFRWKTGRPFLRVSYHQLANNPARELRRICTFLNVSYEDAMLEYHTKHHHYVGGNAGSTKSSEIKEDTAWKHDMPFRYRILFDCIFGVPNIFFLRIAKFRSRVSDS